MCDARCDAGLLPASRAAISVRDARPGRERYGYQEQVSCKCPHRPLLPRDSSSTSYYYRSHSKNGMRWLSMWLARKRRSSFGHGASFEELQDLGTRSLEHVVLFESQVLLLKDGVLALAPSVSSHAGFCFSKMILTNQRLADVESITIQRHPPDVVR